MQKTVTYLPILPVVANTNFEADQDFLISLYSHFGLVMSFVDG